MPTKPSLNRKRMATKMGKDFYRFMKQDTKSKDATKDFIPKYRKQD
jgi:hypothetical protein